VNSVMRSSSLSLLGGLALCAVLFPAANGIDLTITKSKTVAIPQTLGGGYMWEVCLFVAPHKR
jgi:hypothetical protein